VRVDGRAPCGGEWEREREKQRLTHGTTKALGPPSSDAQREGRRSGLAMRVRCGLTVPV
jgi:hypothetical protein